jgi:hypothetical protein
MKAVAAVAAILSLVAVAACGRDDHSSSVNESTMSGSGSSTSAGDGDDSGGGLLDPGGIPECSVVDGHEPYDLLLPETPTTVDPLVSCNDPAVLRLDDPDFLNSNPAEPDQALFDLWVYRPTPSEVGGADDTGGGGGDWPVEDLPVVLFSSGAAATLTTQEGSIVDASIGAGTSDPASHLYHHLFEKLVTDLGFVVVAIEPTGPDWNSARREAAMACAMMWLADDAELSANTSDSYVFMGHGRGANAADFLSHALLCDAGEEHPDLCCYEGEDPGSDECAPGVAPLVWDDLPAHPVFSTAKQCASVLVAPTYTSAAPDVDTRLPTLSTSAPPRLVVQGTGDFEAASQAIAKFDRRTPEDLQENVGSPTLPEFLSSQSVFELYDEVLLWAYGPGFATWGGADEDPSVLGTAIARAALPHYVGEFLRWQIFSDISARGAFTVLTQAEAGGAEDCAAPGATDECYPGELLDPQLWETDELAGHYRGCDETPPLAAECGGVSDPSRPGLERPLLMADITQGSADGAGRLAVDYLERGGDITHFPYAGYQLPGLEPCIGVGNGEPLSSIQDVVTLSSPDGGNPELCIGVGETLADWQAPAAGPGTGFNAFASKALGVVFGGARGTAEIDWDLTPEADGLDLTSYTHLSFRVGNFLVGGARMPS